MAFDLPAIREALAGALSTMTIGTQKVIGHARVPGAIVAPAVVVEVENIRYHATAGRGSDELTMVASYYLSTSVDTTSQALADELLSGGGTLSVMKAIEDNKTLDSTVDYCVLTEGRKPGLLLFGGTEYLGVEFVFEVTAS